MSSTLERSDSEDLDHIPMADEGEETEDEAKDEVGGGGASNTGISSLLGDDRSLSPIRISDPDEAGTPAGGGSQTSFLLDADLTPEEQEEKARLIAQVLELQNTLDDLR